MSLRSLVSYPAIIFKEQVNLNFFHLTVTTLSGHTGYNHVNTTMKKNTNCGRTGRVVEQRRSDSEDRDKSRRGRCVPDIKTARKDTGDVPAVWVGRFTEHGWSFVVSYDVASYQNSSTSPDESLLVLVQCRSVLITISSCSVLNQPSPYRLSWPLPVVSFLPVAPLLSRMISQPLGRLVRLHPSRWSPLWSAPSSRHVSGRRLFSSLLLLFLFSASLSSPVSSFLSPSLLIHSLCSSK